jgi:hypothetical protein
VLELSPSDPPEAMRLLKEARTKGRLVVDDAALYGAQVHVIAPDVRSEMDTVRSVLQAGGIEPGPMDVIAPSLEDVFLASIR